ncbi:hypothetical protein L596_010771 [Steinernema carpocapsae]|uniref:Uncharacterized protein n=1 Tax=Steinernema carpocapsae TaxID=34508 RepID=A0A4U5PJU5_STECR|nr:hypothetical protein L596_010771 [Steinernema carpocapsae]
MARKHVFVALLFIAVLIVANAFLKPINGLFESLGFVSPTLKFHRLVKVAVTDMVGKLVLVALFSTAALIAADASSNPISGLLGSLGSAAGSTSGSLEDAAPASASNPISGLLGSAGSIASAAKPADNSGNALDQTLTNLGLGNATPGLNTTLGGLGTLLNGLTTIVGLLLYVLGALLGGAIPGVNAGGSGSPLSAITGLLNGRAINNVDDQRAATQANRTLLSRKEVVIA